MYIPCEIIKVVNILKFLEYSCNINNLLVNLGVIFFLRGSKVILKSEKLILMINKFFKNQFWQNHLILQQILERKEGIAFQNLILKITFILNIISYMSLYML